MDKNRHTKALKILALVCLVVVSISVTVEASHFHSTYEESSSNSKPCPICVAAHTLTPALVNAVLTVAPAVLPIAQKICLTESSLQQSILGFELSVRPPPVF